MTHSNSPRIAARRDLLARATSPFCSCIEPLESRIAPAFAAAVPLGSLDGTNGFKRSGVADGDVAGYSVSAAGDVKGDGFADCSPALSMLTRAAATAGRPT